jgi:hypothetical protein
VLLFRYSGTDYQGGKIAEGRAGSVEDCQVDRFISFERFERFVRCLPFYLYSDKSKYVIESTKF